MIDHLFEPTYVDRDGVTITATCFVCGRPGVQRRRAMREGGKYYAEWTHRSPGSELGPNHRPTPEVPGQMSLLD